ncbi:MAG: hypothetical protein ACE5LU_16375 [Anaerolineae bacterium]
MRSNFALTPYPWATTSLIPLPFAPAHPEPLRKPSTAGNLTFCDLDAKLTPVDFFVISAAVAQFG